MENDTNNLEELLVLYALGELEPEEVSAVEKELRKRPELAATVEKYRRTDETLLSAFTLSDKAAPQTHAEESAKPKADLHPEKPRNLAFRLAFSAAALALIVVVGALLYPQLATKDVQVAMSPNEVVEDKSVPVETVTEGVQLEEPAPAADALVLEEAQEDAPRFALNAMDVAEEADEASVPEAAAEVEMDMVEEDMVEEDMVQAAPDFAPLNAAAPAPAAAPAMEAEESAGLMRAAAPQSAAPEPEEAHGQYYMRNALYDIPGQKTIEGMAPIKGEIPPMKEELLQESALGEMAVDQMNKRLDSQRRVQTEKNAFKKSRQKGVAYGAESAPAPGSYVVLQKSVMEGNRLPNPESVKVEQWLSYFGVVQPVKAKDQERKSEAADDKDAQFVKAVNQFAAALSSSEPADVKAFEEVLDLLKDSVGDDPKRLEFKAIVEKTIEIKKRSE